MNILYPLGLVSIMDQLSSKPDDTLYQTHESQQKIVTRNFDPKLLFLGSAENPLKLCQKLLETVVNHPVFCTSRPSISVPSLVPKAMDHLPATAQNLQVVTLGNKFNWRANEQEALFYVTDYDSLRMEGTKTRREIGIEDYLEDQKLSRADLFGVIYQRKEPLWLSGIHSAEIFNFKKRLANVLKIAHHKVFWVKNDKQALEFIENVMYYIYRRRVDKECEVKA